MYILGFYITACLHVGKECNILDNCSVSRQETYLRYLRILRCQILCLVLFVLHTEESEATVKVIVFLILTCLVSVSLCP